VTGEPERADAIAEALVHVVDDRVQVRVIGVFVAADGVATISGRSSTKSWAGK
jgi:hypothetical protein